MKMRRGFAWAIAVSVVGLVCAGVYGVRAQQAQTQKQQAGQSPANQQQKPGEQSKPAGQQDQDPPKVQEFTVNVRLAVTVNDNKTGRYVVDLKKSDFEIFEDKVPQSILELIAQTDLPLDVAVLMDTSNSVKPKLKFEKDAAVSFLQTMLTSRKDRALFVTFDSQIELHQDFSNRIDLLTKAIDKVKAQGETKMYDAIYQICEEKMLSPALAGRRRAMVVLTDGEDTVSERALADAIEIAQRSETIVYVISTKAAGFFGVQGGTIDKKEDKELKRLAEETGGRAFFTSEVIELERSFSAVARELRSQYLLAYEPVNNKYDGKYRKIEVRLPNNKDFKVRTKTGYTATPPRSVTGTPVTQ
ncbi:MAG: VWA domain-containing protein [Blastocatellia bacterium]